MIRDPDNAKAKIEELCRRGEKFLGPGDFLRQQDSADIQYWFSETLTLLEGLLGAESAASSVITS